MSKWLSVAMKTLMLAAALAACSGGDDDDDPTATRGPDATPTATAAATATPTASPGGSGAEAPQDASPTAPAASPTSTVQATAPSRPISTETRTPPTPTATTEQEVDTELEELLLAALLQPEDFTGDWTQDAFGPMELDTDDSDELCGVSPFPDRDQRMAGVEAEYTLDGDPLASVIENIVVFPDETALDAMDFAREASACGEWTDDAGNVFTITPIDGPVYGDDSYTSSLTVEIDGIPIYGEYTFIRVGGAIATVAFITLESEDVAPYQALVEVAAERLEEAVAGNGGVGSELVDLLLAPEDIALVDSVNVWTAGNPIDPTDEERFSVCGAPSFPDALGAVAEAGHELDADEETGPFAMHSVVQMAAGDGTTAMEWIRTELSCPSWSDDDGEFVVSETGDLDVGDDTYWLIVTVTASDGSGLTVQVGFGFTQLGDTIAVVGLAAENSLDAELFGAIIALGAEKVFAGMP